MYDEGSYAEEKERNDLGFATDLCTTGSCNTRGDVSHGRQGRHVKRGLEETVAFENPSPQPVATGIREKLVRFDMYNLRRI